MTISPRKQKLAPVRCAIYTRKSTEEGLDKEFNTLDAQREAAEAYIGSQKCEGWVALSDRYDDGGFTGGNMERPALQRLLEDIAQSKIDCLVVYKVDRLSRSLLDFARLMETFEKHNVSFVSVTQHFNTRQSMGRLTLNVLLSFAQFEREIISERTRDKIAAARRKGKWTGGTPPLGYDVDREVSRLTVNAEEAERVRAIFKLYLELGSLIPTVQELGRRAWHNKQWTTRQGKCVGGKPFAKGNLYHLLTNVTYSGKLKYKDEVHSGEHEAIVPATLFERVQKKLRENGREHRTKKTPSHRCPGLLEGLVFCHQCGASMSHTYAAKGSRRYRYYTCSTAQRRGRDQCGGKTLPAAQFESLVVTELRTSHHLKDQWEDFAATDRQECVQGLIQQVTYDSEQQELCITLSSGAGDFSDPSSEERAGDSQRHQCKTIKRRVVFTAPGKEQAVNQEASVEPSQQRVPRVARLMALAIRLAGLIQSRQVSDYAQLARLGHVSRARITQILNLNLLAPDIQEALLFLPKLPPGRDPIAEKHLRSVTQEPDWRRQRELWAELNSTSSDKT